MKKLLILAALTILTTSAAGCCSSWYPGKYLVRKVGFRGGNCSSCDTMGTTYVGSDYIAPVEMIEVPVPGPVGGK